MGTLFNQAKPNQKTAEGARHRRAERMADEFPTFAPATRIMAVSYALAGNLTLAEKAAKKSIELDPSQRVAVLLSQMPLRRVEDRNLWEQGLLRAGFPQ